VRRARGILAAALMLVVGSCASTRFDRLYEAGMYERAAEVYRSDSTLHRSERALYRAGMMHALPESPVYDPGLAREEFDRLLLLHPGTGHRARVEHLRALLEQVVRQREDAGRARTELRRLRTRLGRLGARVRRLEEELDGRQARLDTLASENRRLLELIRARADTLRRLRTELRRLKAIDLKGVQDTSGAGGPPLR